MAGAAGGLQAMPGMALPMAGLAGVPPGLQSLFLQQLQYQQFRSLFHAAQINPQLVPHLHTPQMAPFLRAFQQQVLTQAQAAKPGIRPAAASIQTGAMPTVVTAPKQSKDVHVKTACPSTAVGAPATHVSTTQPTAKKRKTGEHLRLPDKYQILPDSPLFTGLQDLERRIDASLARKKAALVELANIWRRGKKGKRPSTRAILHVWVN